MKEIRWQKWALKKYLSHPQKEFIKENINLGIAKAREISKEQSYTGFENGPVGR